jgi:NADH:ubiquinone oxidoreductase subunit F (NADH-binding)/NADH:ubiquinone oxidoreductase subunit E
MQHPPASATPDRLTPILERFPRERQWLLPALQVAQHAIGFLPPEALAATAAHLRVPASEVYGVATHYPEFRLTPRGRHHVRACTGVSCALLGSRDVLDAIRRRYGIEPGTGSADAPITLETADCFFECSVAPVVEIDGRYRGRVTAAEVPRLATWLAESRAAPSVVADAEPMAAAAAGSAVETLAALVAGAAARRAARPGLRLLVQMGTCGRAVGAEPLRSALRDTLAARGVAAEVIEGACNGMCYAAPLVEVQRAQAPRFLVERLAPEQVDALVECLLDDDGDFSRVPLRGVVWHDERWRGLTPAAEHPFWKTQERVLLARCGVVDPNELDDALLHGAYRALAEALDGPPAAVIERVKASGLQGRGGAFFPTALKWEACRAAAGRPKYVVMNGEEGEPGIFKDRHLMEGDPHQVLEGVLLAAYAAGATHAVLYIHGEADLSAERLARAVAQARAAGIIGERLLGRDVACTAELRRGAGGFVLGEETALLESIEGRRAMPRTRPPFPVESGLWGKPTVINNVETLAAIPAIVSRGGAWFAGLGTATAPGTKVFGLSGPIRRPGVVETRNGVTLRALVEGIGGGALGGAPVQGAVVGGPSGTIVPAALFDVPMEPRGQVSTGTGGVVAVPAGASVVEIVRTLLAFNAAESCGKCTPCREGTPRLLAMLDEMGGTADRERTVARIRDLATTIQLASLCGLGQAAPLALLRGLETFPDAFARRPAPGRE